MRKIFQLINQNLKRLINLSIKKDSSFVKNLPLITISREKGSGGRIIAHLVAKRLSSPWKVYHKEIIENIARDAHLTKELIKEIDERKLSFVEEMINDFFGKKYLSLTRYQKLLTQTIAKIAQRGYAIIVGRGAEYLAPYALKVRIICEMEQRIKNLMKYERLTRDEAINLIEKSDKERTDFIQSLYHHDIKKAHHYDLVIRTSRDLSIEDAAHIIVLAAKRKFGLK